MKHDVQPAELNKRLNSGEKIQIVDVRTSLEFGMGHIPGALNIPLNTIDSTFDGVNPNETIVVVCQGGVRSVTACEKVDGKYPKLWNLVGGTSAWQAAGLEVEKSLKGPRSLDRQTHLVAGVLIVISFALFRSKDPSWIYLALLPAFGLLLDAFTDVCPMSLMLRRMPWNA